MTMGQTSQLHNFQYGEGRNFGCGGQYDAHPSCTLSRRERGEIDDPLLLRRRTTARLFTKWLYPTLLNFAHNGVCVSVQSGFGAMASRRFYHHLSCEGRQQSGKGLEKGGFPTSIASDQCHQLPRLESEGERWQQGLSSMPKGEILKRKLHDIAKVIIFFD